MPLLVGYLNSMRLRHASGAVAETAYYDVLETLLNEVGHTLSPSIHAALSLHYHQGAGVPDGGLFTIDQLRNASDPLLGQVPARGAIEVEGLADDVAQRARTAQVRRYLSRYSQVLVTNYRDFLLVRHEEVAERYTLAPSPDAFWSLTRQPRLALPHEVPFVEFLQRVMQSGAPDR